MAKSTYFTLLYFTLHNLVIFGNLTNFIASKKHRNPRGCLASPKQSDHKLTRQSHLPLVVLPALLALRDPGGLQPSCYGPTHVPQAERPTPIKLLRSLQHNNAITSNEITTLNLFIFMVLYPQSTISNVNVWLQSRSLPARGRVGLEVHRCLCIIDAGNVFISTVMG